MKKPTLKDFISNPSQAMQEGYYPSLFSCFCYAVTVWMNKGMRESICAVTYDLCTEPLRTKPLYFLLFLVIIFVAITYPVFFLVWWLLFYGWFKEEHKEINNEKEDLK